REGNPGKLIAAGGKDWISFPSCFWCHILPCMTTELFLCFVSVKSRQGRVSGLRHLGNVARRPCFWHMFAALEAVGPLRPAMGTGGTHHRLLRDQFIEGEKPWAWNVFFCAACW